MSSHKIQNLKGGVILESKNRQQYEGSPDITFRVTLKSWPKYYVILLTESESQENLEISPQTFHLMDINRYFSAIISNIQETEMYDIVGSVSGQGSYERSILFKIRDEIDWNTLLRDDE